DVRDVVEQQPRHRDQLQVVRAGRVLPTAPLENRVLRMERKRDEGEKTAALVLLLAETQQMVDPLLVCLDVPVEHRAVRRDSEPVRSVVRVEPEVRMLFPRRYQQSQAV